MESEGPYNPYKHQTEMWGTKECDKQCKACIYAEGRKSMEKDFKELLDIAKALTWTSDIWSNEIRLDKFMEERGLE